MHFKLAESKSQISRAFSRRQFPDGCSLLAVCNRFGFYAMGAVDGFQVGLLSDLRSSSSPSQAAVQVPLADSFVHQLCISDGQESPVLAVVVKSRSSCSLKFYHVHSLLARSPPVLDCFHAVALDDGSEVFVESLQVLPVDPGVFLLLQGGRVRAYSVATRCFVPGFEGVEGVVAFHAHGQFVYAAFEEGGESVVRKISALDGSVVDEEVCSFPDDGSSSICHLSSMGGGGDDDELAVGVSCGPDYLLHVLSGASPSDGPVFDNFLFPDDPAAVEGSARFFCLDMPAWKTRVFTFSSASDSLVLSRNVDGQQWVEADVDENERIELPLPVTDGDDNEDELVGVIGVGLDLTSTTEVPSGSPDIPSMPAMPIALIYTRDGSLLMYHVINKSRSRYPGMVSQIDKMVSQKVDIPAKTDVVKKKISFAKPAESPFSFTASPAASGSFPSLSKPTFTPSESPLAFNESSSGSKMFNFADVNSASDSAIGTFGTIMPSLAKNAPVFPASPRKASLPSQTLPPKSTSSVAPNGAKGDSGPKKVESAAPGVPAVVEQSPPKPTNVETIANAEKITPKPVKAESITVASEVAEFLAPFNGTCDNMSADLEQHAKLSESLFKKVDKFLENHDETVVEANAAQLEQHVYELRALCSSQAKISSSLKEDLLSTWAQLTEAETFLKSKQKLGISKFRQQKLPPEQALQQKAIRDGIYHKSHLLDTVCEQLKYLKGTLDDPNGQDQGLSEIYAKMRTINQGALTKTKLIESMTNEVDGMLANLDLSESTVVEPLNRQQHTRPQITVNRIKSINDPKFRSRAISLRQMMSNMPVSRMNKSNVSKYQAVVSAASEQPTIVHTNGSPQRYFARQKLDREHQSPYVGSSLRSQQPRTPSPDREIQSPTPSVVKKAPNVTAVAQKPPATAKAESPSPSIFGCAPTKDAQSVFATPSTAKPSSVPKLQSDTKKAEMERPKSIFGTPLKSDTSKPIFEVPSSNSMSAFGVPADTGSKTLFGVEAVAASQAKFGNLSSSTSKTSDEPAKSIFGTPSAVSQSIFDVPSPALKSPEKAVAVTPEVAKKKDTVLDTPPKAATPSFSFVPQDNGDNTALKSVPGKQEQKNAPAAPVTSTPLAEKKPDKVESAVKPETPKPFSFAVTEQKSPEKPVPTASAIQPAEKTEPAGQGGFNLNEVSDSLSTAATAKVEPELVKQESSISMEDAEEPMESSATTFTAPSQTLSFAQPTFGAPPATSGFGSTTSPATTTAFGSTSTFGSNNTPTAFGSGNTPNAFGSGNAPTAFGSTATNAFGTPTAASSTAPAFGASSFKQSAPAFGSSSFGTPAAAPAFGASSFGAAPTFGTSSFGTPASAAPSFGASSFGKPAFGQPSTGTPQQQQAAVIPPTGKVFGQGASTGAPSFSALANQGGQQPSSFGQPGFGAAPPNNTVFGQGGFGASTAGAFGGQQQQQQPTAFGMAASSNNNQNVFGNAPSNPPAKPSFSQFRG